jgi:hypothetical protein
MTYTGIDPGKKGAIVSISEGRIVGQRCIPLQDDGSIDLSLLCDLLDGLKGHKVCLELVQPIYGVSKTSSGTMMRGLGNIEAALHCKGVPFTYVRPKVWQKMVWGVEDIVTVPAPTAKRPDKTKTDTKATSLKCAESLYPDADLRYGDLETQHKGRARKKVHDGLVDALLIAEYCRMISNEIKIMT